MARLLESLRELEGGSRGPRAIVDPRGIHERRQVIELLNIKRDLASVLEGAAAGILEIDARGRVTYANAEAEDLLGLGRASLMGSEILSVLPKPCLSAFQPMLARFESDSGPARRGMAFAIERRALRAVLTSIWSEGVRQSIVVTLLDLAQDADAQN